MYQKGLILEVMRAYCEGMPVNHIGDLFSIPNDVANEIIDRYADLFLGDDWYAEPPEGN